LTHTVHLTTDVSSSVCNWRQRCFIHSYH